MRRDAADRPLSLARRIPNAGRELNGKNKLDGVSETIRHTFRLPGLRKLLERITPVYDFRNSYFAYSEMDLTDRALAERSQDHRVETLVLL
ncbi:MAG: hypothetical protein OXI87_00115 [Albidovulum sp.]|nr:hypothetical protein [Albidovulum sp.]